jgi:hypothetical protein
VKCGHNMSGFVAVLTVLATFTALPLPGLCGEDKVAAREHYATGTRLYEVREYAEALKEYKAAYVAKADPAFLFNIGQCLRKLDRNEEALDFFQQYLKKAPADDPNRVRVKARIRNIQAGLSSAADPFDQSDAPKAAQTPAAEEKPPLASTPSRPTGRVETVAPLAAESEPVPAATLGLPSALAQPPTTPPPSPAHDLAAQPFVTTSSPTQPVGVDLAATAPVQEDHAPKPVYRTWWFWTGVGTAVVAGTVTAIALSSGGGGTNIPSTALGSRSLP